MTFLMMCVHFRLSLPMCMPVRGWAFTNHADFMLILLMFMFSFVGFRMLVFALSFGLPTD